MNIQWPAGTVHAHYRAEADAIAARMLDHERWVMVVALMGADFFLVPCGNRPSRVVELFIYFRKQVEPYRDWWEHADQSGFALLNDCCDAHHALKHWLEDTLPCLEMDGLVRMYQQYREDESLHSDATWNSIHRRESAD